MIQTQSSPNGKQAEHRPVIISASRATDIPAFYADWFVARWKAGHCRWRNPFNGAESYISFGDTRAAVFWSKNPRPMLKHIDFLQDHIPVFYFQFTLNDYIHEGLEPHLPDLAQRIETFAELSQRIGKRKVIWRYDPLILTDSVTVETLLSRIQHIGDLIAPYTDKLVFSFADISGYTKVARNMSKAQIQYREFDLGSMREFAEGLARLNTTWHLELATCSEAVALEEYGIVHNKCIDPALLASLACNDRQLMSYLGARHGETDLFGEEAPIIITKNNKDRGQRALCGCAKSKDIGRYDTCPHGCVYCYANNSYEAAARNYSAYLSHPENERLG